MTNSQSVIESLNRDELKYELRSTKYEFGVGY